MNVFFYSIRYTVYLLRVHTLFIEILKMNGKIGRGCIRFVFQLTYLRLQMQEQLFVKISERFEDGYDNISTNIQEQMALMADLYQFYTFIQVFYSFF